MKADNMPALDGTRLWLALSLSIGLEDGNHGASSPLLHSEQVDCTERIGSIYWFDFSPPLTVLPSFAVQ